jgi:hypothetical protein
MIFKGLGAIAAAKTSKNATARQARHSRKQNDFFGKAPTAGHPAQSAEKAGHPGGTPRKAAPKAVMRLIYERIIKKRSKSKAIRRKTALFAPFNQKNNIQKTRGQAQLSDLSDIKKNGRFFAPKTNPTGNFSRLSRF